jgi:hypothetical protein
MALKTFGDTYWELEPTYLSRIEVVFEYNYLPLKTFLEVNNIILETHDYLIKLFELDKEPIYKYYRFEVAELRTGSAIISFEPKFEFPNNTKKTSKLEKAIKKFALVSAILGSALLGMEIYKTYLEIKKLKREETEIKNTTKTEINPKLVEQAKTVGLNLDSLLAENNKSYIYAVQDNLRNTIKEKNIYSLKINGQEIRKPRLKPKGGNWDL